MTKKPYTRLIASSLLSVVSITMMVTATYAWVTLAGSPALVGVQINIGGDNTIMMAPDIQTTVDGQVVHYPGVFQKAVDIMNEKSYAYLKDLSGLSPVSTADGIHWFIPEMDENGVLRISSLDDFVMDDTLQYANVTNDSAGGYAYVDFWVVSPMDNCTLRISIGDDGEGSYLIQLPEIVKDDTKASGYTLSQESGTIASCARVGFLISEDGVSENAAMEHYAESEDYNDAYHSLKGIYQEPGSTAKAEDYRFIIYEPNGTTHANEGLAYIQTTDGLVMETCEEGSYVVTNPMGYENGKVVLKNIKDILQVQTENTWHHAAEGETILKQLLQASLAGKDVSTWNRDDFMKYFYGKYLNSQYSQYITPGPFFAETFSLYYSGNLKKTSAEQVSTLALDNTVYSAKLVKLERNVPQRIRMYVWLEGQDVDCTSGAALEYFTLGIELAGSTEDS